MMQRFLRIDDIVCRTESPDGVFAPSHLFPQKELRLASRPHAAAAGIDNPPRGGSGRRPKQRQLRCVEADDDSKLFNAIGTTSESILVNAETMRYFTPYDSDFPQNLAEREMTSSGVSLLASSCPQYIVVSKDAPVEGILPRPWRMTSSKLQNSMRHLCIYRRPLVDAAGDTRELMLNRSYLEKFQRMCEHEKNESCVEHVPLADDGANGRLADAKNTHQPQSKIKNIPDFCTYRGMMCNFLKARHHSLDYITGGVNEQIVRSRVYFGIQPANSKKSSAAQSAKEKKKQQNKSRGKQHRDFSSVLGEEMMLKRQQRLTGTAATLELEQALPFLRSSRSLTEAPHLWFLLFLRCYRWLDFTLTPLSLGEVDAQCLAGKPDLRSLTILTAPASKAALGGVAPQDLWYYFCVNHGDLLPDLLLRAYDMHEATLNATRCSIINLYGTKIDYYVRSESESEVDYMKSLGPQCCIHGFVLDAWSQALLNAFGGSSAGAKGSEGSSGRRVVRIFSYLALQLILSKPPQRKSAAAAARSSPSLSDDEQTYNTVQFRLSSKSLRGATDVIFPINLDNRHWVVAHYYSCLNDGDDDDGENAMQSRMTIGQTTSSRTHALVVFDTFHVDSLKEELAKSIQILRSSIIAAIPSSGNERWSVKLDTSMVQEAGSNDCGLWVMRFTAALLLGESVDKVIWLSRGAVSYVLFAIPRNMMQQRLLDVLPLPEPE